MEVLKRVFRVKTRTGVTEPRLPAGLTFTLLYETPPVVAVLPAQHDPTETEAVWAAVQEWFAARGQPVPDEERAAYEPRPPKN